MNSLLFDACSFAENRIGQRHVNPQTSLRFRFQTMPPLATTSPHPSEARRPRCGQDNAAKTKSPVRLCGRYATLARFILRRFQTAHKYYDFNDLLDMVIQNYGQ